MFYVDFISCIFFYLYKNRVRFIVRLVGKIDQIDKLFNLLKNILRFKCYCFNLNLIIVFFYIISFNSMQ